MCFSSPSIPKPPMPAQRQAIRAPVQATDYTAADDLARRRRAMAATPFMGALGLGAPSTTPTVLGG